MYTSSDSGRTMEDTSDEDVEVVRQLITPPPPNTKVSTPTVGQERFVVVSSTGLIARFGGEVRRRSPSLEGSPGSGILVVLICFSATIINVKKNRHYFPFISAPIFCLSAYPLGHATGVEGCCCHGKYGRGTSLGRAPGRV